MTNITTMENIFRTPYFGNLIAKNDDRSQAPVAHACSPSDLGDWDREDQSLRPAPGK
jgi:hypothetical protein